MYVNKNRKIDFNNFPGEVYWTLARKRVLLMITVLFREIYGSYAYY